jgi:hypothetical protein
MCPGTVGPGDGTLPSSFRDPHGFVYRRDGVLLRQVDRVHAEAFDLLVASGLYDRLVEDRLLIPHAVVDLGLALTDGAAYVIRPEFIPFVSLPYEWTWTQLRDAALLTLDIQARAMVVGMTLRDATAFNVTFYRGRPTFIDTTSIGILAPDRPWAAYRQFCQHFLAPLALMSYRDSRLVQLSLAHLDGIPLDLANELLPRRAKARPGLAMHLGLHAGSQRRHADDTEAPTKRPFSARAFEGLIESLRRAIGSLPEPQGLSRWRDYYGQADHYSEAAADQKEALVERWVRAAAPSSVWDIGANTGRFSAVSAGLEVDTVALDSDAACIDEVYRAARRDGQEHLVAAVVDIANPTPAIGWANRERPSLRERGPADLVLALAVLHHLVIGAGVPLPIVLEELRHLGRAVIVEWVPKDDQKVQRLLRDRDDVFGSYASDVFEEEVERRFSVRAREQLSDSDRTMLLLESR